MKSLAEDFKDVSGKYNKTQNGLVKEVVNIACEVFACPNRAGLMVMDSDVHASTRVVG